MAKDEIWDDIPLAPLTGKLDTRSRPSDLLPGEFRYKLNFGLSKTGKLVRSTGYSALDFGEIDGDSPNWDFHFRGHERLPFNLLFESTAPDGVRRLFAGDEISFSVLNNLTSQWDEIASGLGDAGATWKAAGLSDKVFFTNNVDQPRQHTLGSTSSSTIPELQARGTTKAKLVFQFAGVIVWMNLEENTERFGSRIRWSNYRDGAQYDPGTADTVASFQDLDYGDDILNAVEMGGALWIFTTNSIWRMVVQVTEDTIFGFTKIYSDPKNQTGCLAYPNTLVSDGRSAWWFSRKSAWTINPFLAQPKSTDDHDWLLKATGLVFEGDGSIDTSCCEAPIGYFDSDNSEIYFFYPRKNRVDQSRCINDFGLVLNTQFNTGHHIDYGMTALASFRRQVFATQICSSVARLIGASAQDWALKFLRGEDGEFFGREHLLFGDIEDDIPHAAYALVTSGYKSQLVGLCPLGYPDMEKILRSLLIDHDTRESDEENVIKLRIGNSHVLQDPLATGPRCKVQWHDIRVIDVDGQDYEMPLACPDEQDVDEMTEENLRPSDSSEWDMWEQGRYLYFEITITDEDGNDPVGGDTAWSRLVFSTTTA